MTITIINGTNRVNNNTLKISNQTVFIARDLGHRVSLVDLNNFAEMFRGKFITLKTANKLQRDDIERMIEADMIFFIVPTYHSGIPSPLKNFLDSLKQKEAYSNKIIGLIASSNKNQDHGARQTMQILNGILAFEKLHSFIIPIISIIHYDTIDHGRIESFIRYAESFANLQPHYPQAYPSKSFYALGM